MLSSIVTGWPFHDGKNPSSWKPFPLAPSPFLLKDNLCQWKLWSPGFGCGKGGEKCQESHSLTRWKVSLFNSRQQQEARVSYQTEKTKRVESGMRRGQGSGSDLGESFLIKLGRGEDRRGKVIKDDMWGKRQRSTRKRERCERLLLLTPAAPWHWVPKISGLWQSRLVQLYIPEVEGPMTLQVLGNLVPTSATSSPSFPEASPRMVLVHTVPSCACPDCSLCRQWPSYPCLPANPPSWNRESLLLSMARLPAREWSKKG